MEVNYLFAKRMLLACAILLSGTVYASAQYRSYDFKGCSKDKKSVSQSFIWDMKMGKATIMKQSASVKSAFPTVAGRYSASQLKQGKHLNALLGGRIPKDGQVTFNPPKIGGSC